MTSRHGPLFWCGVVAGWGLMAVGVLSLLAEERGRRGFAPYFVGGLLTHDLVVVPAVLAVGAVVGRLVPRAARAAVHAGAVISAGLALVAYPLLRGDGRSAGNPSALPRAYGSGLAVSLAVVWVAVAATAVVATWRRRRS